MHGITAPKQVPTIIRPARFISRHLWSCNAGPIMRLRARLIARRRAKWCGATRAIARDLTTAAGFIGSRVRPSPCNSTFVEDTEGFPSGVVNRGSGGYVTPAPLWN